MRLLLTGTTYIAPLGLDWYVCHGLVMHVCCPMSRTHDVGCHNNKKIMVFSLHQDPDVDMFSCRDASTPVDQCFGSRSGLRRAKMTHKNRKRFRNIVCFEVLDVLF